MGSAENPNSWWLSSFHQRFGLSPKQGCVLGLQPDRARWCSSSLAEMKRYPQIFAPIPAQNLPSTLPSHIPFTPLPISAGAWLNLLQVGSLLATAAAASTYFQPLLRCRCHISSEAAPPRWQRQPGVLKRLPRGFSLSATPHFNSQQQASEPLAPQVGKSLPRGEIALRKIEKMGKCHTRQAS